MENSSSATRTRTNSALKWLANEYASVQGELELVRNALTTLQERERRLSAELEGLGLSMQRFDAELDPTNIRSVSAWRERNGGRGTLQAYALDALRQAGVAGLSVDMMAELWATELGDASLLVSPLREQFKENRVSPCLKRLKVKGLVTCERMPGGGNKDYLWRIVPGAKLRKPSRAR